MKASTREKKKKKASMPYHLRKPVLSGIFPMQFKKWDGFFPGKSDLSTKVIWFIIFFVTVLRRYCSIYLCSYIATCTKHLLDAVHSNFIITLRAYATPNSFHWDSNVSYLTDLLEQHTNSQKPIETTER